MVKIRCISFLLSLLVCLPAMAQKVTEKEVPGEYMLSGVMETAAGFLIKADHTFQYGFTYGAADKSGHGSWRMEGKKLILNSEKPQPPSDFILKSSDASLKNGIKIKITDAAGNPYPYVKCRLASDPEGEKSTDNRGEAYFRNIGTGKLELYHPIFSTRITALQLDPKHTQFIIYPAYNLAEVYFKDYILQVTGNKLTAPTLPGMPPEDTAGKRGNYTFTRQK